MYKVYLDEITLFFILGILLGGRIGGILYNLNYYSKNFYNMIIPLDVLNDLKFIGFSGMSYHGALFGSYIAILFFIKIYRIDCIYISELILPIVPIGYFFGRIANFINGELYGCSTLFPLGMFFPCRSADILRHPSQLYEAFFEGISIFIILYYLRNKKSTRRFTLSFYLFIYGIFRFFIEFFRQPDIHIGYLFSHLSMGQILSLVMIIIAILMIFFEIKILYENYKFIVFF